MNHVPRRAGLHFGARSRVLFERCLVILSLLALRTDEEIG